MLFIFSLQISLLRSFVSNRKTLFVLFLLLFFHKFVYAISRKLSNRFDLFFHRWLNWKWSEIILFLMFLPSSPPVPIYSWFCNFLCTLHLESYQRYKYEFFRIGRLLSEVVPITFVLRHWWHSSKAHYGLKKLYEFCSTFLSTRFLRDAR